MAADRQRKPVLIAETIPFYDVARLLEETSKCETNPDRNRRVRKFVEQCRRYFRSLHGTYNSKAANGDSLFCIMRIFLPALDQVRPAYGFKTIGLGRILAEALGLNDKDKMLLTKFKDNVKDGDGEAKNFAQVVFKLMSRRFSAVDKAKAFSLQEMHDTLDRLAKGRPGADTGVTVAIQKQVMFDLFASSRLTPLEGKWLVRLLLKNLEFGLKRNMVLKMIHKQANEMFDKTGDLERICKMLNDPMQAVEAEGVQLFYFCKPMLCLRTTDLADFGSNEHDDDAEPRPSTSSSSKKKPPRDPDAPSTVMTPPFIIETKWDGERFQIHWDGKEWKYMSKKGFDYSNSFSKNLTPRLAPQIKPGVTSFVLDGEMMAWHKRNGYFTQKGAEIDVKNLRVDNPNHHPAFVTFDILFHNGVDVSKKRLDERSKILASVLTPKEGTVLISKQTLAKAKEEVETALNAAIDNAEEGLIVKAIDSIYEPGRRGLRWRKIKPEFIADTSVSDLDVLILGAYFTDNCRKGGGFIEKFLVGVIEKVKDKESFFALGSVGSGRLRNSEMDSLVNELSPLLSKRPFPSVNYKAKKKPDLYIDPRKSIVVQVKASEINYSESYALKHTLRFPRITRVRRDKNYHEILTVEEFNELKDASGGKLAKRSDGDYSSYFRKRSTTGSAPKVARTKRQEVKFDEELHTSEEEGEEEPVAKRRALPALPLPVSPKKEGYGRITRSVNRPLFKKPELKWNLFKQQWVFCVYGNQAWKLEMEQDILRYGGKIVQNPVKEPFYIVGESEKYPKVKQAIKMFKYEILKPKWLRDCFAASYIVPLTPSDFYHWTAEGAKAFAPQGFDTFGDPFGGNKASMEEVKTLAQRAMLRIERAPEPEDEEPLNYDEMDAELFPLKSRKRKLNQYRFFQKTKIAIKNKNPVLEAKIEFFGGKIGEEADQDLTHFVLEEGEVCKDWSPPKKNNSVAVVILKWVMDCLAKRQKLDEKNYKIN